VLRSQRNVILEGTLIVMQGESQARLEPPSTIKNNLPKSANMVMVDRLTWAFLQGSIC
jgi:hypothetical protein